ncbi:hypothetical protein [Pontibacter sp. G13]|uniref:hypothetical protein n=1 Tax=Pontibacter sp. G13 TaxID=3074898 RepID=UPI002889A3C8|nr:hypothetical protein [Pontibacter sp. G13]WNJ18228.1 hypothetical protein RJD25_25535 [Pontibacter sp. G13]
MNAAQSQSAFQAVCQQMMDQHPDVELGKMMSAEGLQFRGKVFAFYIDGEMCFKLGKDFDTKAVGMAETRYLSPFKNKGPMKAWYWSHSDESELWPRLGEIALEYLSSTL